MSSWGSSFPSGTEDSATFSCPPGSTAPSVSTCKHIAACHSSPWHHAKAHKPPCRHAELANDIHAAAAHVINGTAADDAPRRVNFIEDGDLAHHARGAVLRRIADRAPATRCRDSSGCTTFTTQHATGKAHSAALLRWNRWGGKRGWRVHH